MLRLKPLNTNNMKIQTTTVTQTANEILGTESKTLYYLIVTNEKEEKTTINVGQKTHESIKKLIGGDTGDIQKAHVEILEENETNLRNKTEELKTKYNKR